MVSAEEHERAVAAVMRHMLFKNAKQPGVPVTRDEVIGVVQAVVAGGGGSQASGSSRKHAALASAMIEEARRKFPSLLGFDMLELHRVARGKGTALSQAATQSSQVVDAAAGSHVPGSQPAAAAAAAAAAAGGAAAVSGNKEYVLRSKLSADWLARFVDVPPSNSHPHSLSYPLAATSALTLTVCAIIKGAGGRISQAYLLQLLSSQLGLSSGNTRHAVFGSVTVDEALAQMEKQRYIQPVRGGGSGSGPQASQAALAAAGDGEEGGGGDEPQMMYELAEAALEGIGAVDLQAFFNKVTETQTD